MAFSQPPWQSSAALRPSDVAQLHSLHDALLTLRKEVVAGWLDSMSTRTAEVQSLCHGARLLAGQQGRDAGPTPVLIDPLCGFVDEGEYLDALRLAGLARNAGPASSHCLHFSCTQRGLLFYAGQVAGHPGKLHARTTFEKSHPVAFAVCIAAIGNHVAYDL